MELDQDFWILVVKILASLVAATLACLAIVVDRDPEKKRLSSKAKVLIISACAVATGSVTGELIGYSQKLTTRSKGKAAQEKLEQWQFDLDAKQSEIAAKQQRFEELQLNVEKLAAASLQGIDDARDRLSATKSQLQTILGTQAVAARALEQNSAKQAQIYDLQEDVAATATMSLQTANLQLLNTYRQMQPLEPFAVEVGLRFDLNSQFFAPLKNELEARFRDLPDDSPIRRTMKFTFRDQTPLEVGALLTQVSETDRARIEKALGQFSMRLELIPSTAGGNLAENSIYMVRAWARSQKPLEVEELQYDGANRSGLHVTITADLRLMTVFVVAETDYVRRTSEAANLYSILDLPGGECSLIFGRYPERALDYIVFRTGIDYSKRSRLESFEFKKLVSLNDTYTKRLESVDFKLPDIAVVRKR
jgi:hypothetical protein